MEIKILLVGCGNIGSRHLQGLLKSKIKSKIFIIEKSKKAVLNAKKRISDTNVRLSTKNIYFNKKKIKHFFFDLIICATPSKDRLKLFKKLVKDYNFKNIILEKIAFQNSEDFEEALNLVNKNNKKCWVNCSRRQQKVYQFLRSKLLKSRILKIEVLGNDWNIGSNSVHFFDLFLFLSNKFKKFTVKESNLLKVKSKHRNYFEFNGRLILKSNNDEIILDNTRKRNDIIIIIKTPKLTIYVNETKEKITLIKNKKQIIKKINFLKQSDLSGKTIEDLKKTNKINLPTLKESSYSHDLVYMSFNNYFTSRKKIINCSIT